MTPSEHIDKYLIDGINAHKSGDLETACVLYQRILKADPWHSDANHNLGVLLSSKNNEEALKYFLNALRNPDILQYWISFIDYCVELVQPHILQRELNRYKIDQDVLKKLNTNYSKREPWLSDYLVNHRSKTLSIGARDNLQNLFRSYTIEKIIKTIKNALVFFPEDSFLYLQYGEALIDNGKFSEAIEPLKKAQFYDPNNSKIYSVLASAYQFLKKDSDAILNYEKAIKLQNTHPFAHYNLGVIYLESAEYQNALMHFECSLEPNQNNLLSVIGMAVSAQKLGQLSNALAYCKQGLIADPNNFTLVRIYLEVLLKLKRLEEAKTFIRNALNQNSNEALLYKFLAKLHQIEGANEAAVDAYCKCLSHTPNDRAAKNALLLLLTSYAAKTDHNNALVKAHNDLANLDIGLFHPFKKSDLLKLLKIVRDILAKYSITEVTHQTQTYMTSNRIYGCERHFKIFKEMKIIPHACYSCFKVQVEVSNIVSLIGLYLLFQRLPPPHRLTRKCMVEVRDNIPGFYKGIIFCSSMNEALKQLRHIEQSLKKLNFHPTSIGIKHGCSEYSIEHPDFSEIDDRGVSKLPVFNDWLQTEKLYDETHGKDLQQPDETLHGMSLHDALIIKNWISYALGIGDAEATVLVETFDTVAELQHEGGRRLNYFRFMP